MKTRDFIIQCGITYQPFVIGINLLKERYTPRKIYVVSTFPAVNAVSTLMNEYFPDIEYIIKGDYISGKGCLADQTEYTQIIKRFMEEAEAPVCLIASGTNWMTFLFSKLIADTECYTVRTHKDFQQKSFTPSKEQFTANSEGRLIKTYEKVSELVPLAAYNSEQRLRICGKTLYFLGHRVTFAHQEAAMLAYFLHIGGELDIREEHKNEFNKFCENNAEYDSYRVMLDDDSDSGFADRFRQNISKINSTLKTCDEIIYHHLKLIKENQFHYRFSTPFHKLIS